MRFVRVWENLVSLVAGKWLDASICGTMRISDSCNPRESFISVHLLTERSVDLLNCFVLVDEAARFRSGMRVPGLPRPCIWLSLVICFSTFSHHLLNGM